jgi:Tol biopolymer transport system component
MLARSDPSAPWLSLVAPWRPSFGPAWSLDGRLIAVAAAGQSDSRIVFVDSQTGASEESRVSGGTTSGLSWLDARSLALNQVPQPGGQNQLFRLPYPAGPLARLTNDPNDYVGISLSGDRRHLVTALRNARMDLWVGDSGGTTGTRVIERVRVSVERIAWSGDQLLYGGFVGGRPTILRVTPGEGTPEEVVSDALTPGLTGDGRTIVFVSSSISDSLGAGSLDLWTADASGRRIRQLVPGVTAGQVVVTPDDQSVIYVSLQGGTVSIWMVPLQGGTPTKLADGGSVTVSPDGTSMAFTAAGPGGGAIVVCSLPACTSHRTIGLAAFDTAIGWTPDGHAIAYAVEGNLLVQPLTGGAPRQLTRFTDNRAIGSFAWSRDGTRLAIARSTVTNDIVLFSGLQASQRP